MNKYTRETGNYPGAGNTAEAIRQTKAEFLKEESPFYQALAEIIPQPDEFGDVQRLTGKDQIAIKQKLKRLFLNEITQEIDSTVRGYSRSVYYENKSNIIQHIQEAVDSMYTEFAERLDALFSGMEEYQSIMDELYRKKKVLHDKIWDDLTEDATLREAEEHEAAQGLGEDHD